VKEATEREKQLAGLLQESEENQKQAIQDAERVQGELEAAQAERDDLNARIAELEGELASARSSAPFGIAQQGTISVDHQGNPVA